MRDEDETLPVFFVTTSSRKSDHLKYLARECDLQEKNIQLYQLPWEYQELQSDEMEFLMEEAMDRRELDKIRDGFFIIEQTSVFLDSEEVEGPGQYFKKWWKGQDQDKLERVISRDPGVTVESGLGLNIPGGYNLTFTNTERGIVKLDGSVLEENSRYSWLSGDDFSSYFSPDGSRKVYTEMAINEFSEYDFRRPNFIKIAGRLKEYNSLIRAGTSINQLQEIAEEYVRTAELKTSEEDTPRATGSPGQSRLTDEYTE